MGSRAWPLAADEIAIGSRDRTLARRDGLTIGGKAHRTSGLAPLEARVGEEPVQPFGNGLALDRLRTRHDPGAHAGRDLAATRDFSGGAQIAEPAIGAGADEDPVDRRAGDRRTGTARDSG
jgi:hypothetical protein